MAEYIEREEVLLAVMNAGCPANTIEAIMSVPTAEVEPVRHGKWIGASISGIDHYRCTECGEYIESVWTSNFDYRYCPNCGARMDGGSNDEE